MASCLSGVIAKCTETCWICHTWCRQVFEHLYILELSRRVIRLIQVLRNLCGRDGQFHPIFYINCTKMRLAAAFCPDLLEVLHQAL